MTPDAHAYAPLPTPDEMAGWDKATIEEFGLSGAILMENAAREALAELKARLGVFCGKSIMFFAGSGNNGGDAFAMARYAKDHGARVLVLHTAHQADYTGETADNFELALKTGVQCRKLSEVDLTELQRYDALVDGLLGTGFHGELRPDALGWVEWINSKRDQCLVLAVDIPSGLNGLTGKPSPIAVRAHVTVTFEAAKVGLAMPEAAPFIGELIVPRIGIPSSVKASSPIGHFLLQPGLLCMLPKPSHDMHKGSAGHVLVIGGSPGLTGAPHLSAKGALRVGCGLVTVACPAGLSMEIKAGNPDIMTLALDGGMVWKPAMARQLGEELHRFESVLLGPGLGRQTETVRFLRSLLNHLGDGFSGRLIVDADALYHLANEPDLAALLPKGAIITPHPGEMARLLGSSTAHVQIDRIGAARGYAIKHGLVVVLKGAATVIARPDGLVALSPFMEPNLAVAGSGDVLGGFMAAFLGFSFMESPLSAMDSAALGVYVHGLCGRALRTAYPYRGNTADDIADAAPTALKEQNTC